MYGDGGEIARAEPTTQSARGFPPPSPESDYRLSRFSKTKFAGDINSFAGSERHTNEGINACAHVRSGDSGRRVWFLAANKMAAG
jgi:hypothetical protein